MLVFLFIFNIYTFNLLYSDDVTNTMANIAATAAVEAVKKTKEDLARLDERVNSIETDVEQLKSAINKVNNIQHQRLGNLEDWVHTLVINGKYADFKIPSAVSSINLVNNGAQFNTPANHAEKNIVKTPIVMFTAAQPRNLLQQ